MWTPEKTKWCCENKQLGCKDEPKCPEIMCLMYCEFGRVKDENGCDMCKCNEKPVGDLNFFTKLTLHLA